MIRSFTPLHIASHQQEGRNTCNIGIRRHTKEELSLLEVSWRENPPEYSQECMNSYLKGQPLPKLPQNRMRRSYSKNFFELNKNNIAKISEDKNKKKPQNLSLSKIIIAIASSSKKNSKVSYKFHAISQSDLTQLRITKKQPINNFKVNQSCNFLLSGSKI